MRRDITWEKAFGSPKFPSYPFEHMPPDQVRGRLWSQTPPPASPERACHREARAGRRERWRAGFSELNIPPCGTPLIHPASYSRYWAYPWISLLTCWLRAHARITYHFGISASGRLRPILIRKIREIASYSCGFAQSDRPNPTQI
ncbi:MAG: hypothetical protein JRF30_00560 [Deltaproteobacteria bacterium]|nr:hypothetical protein [Deltaproteobacteria bacterium]MBW1792919.1 hypothetical protein [Deltaproteobacteria bacterium]MBW2329444.1 hypothetical protein [Deltaproteobacteria bacterium]